MPRPDLSNGNNTPGIVQLYVCDWQLLQTNIATLGQTFPFGYSNNVLPTSDVRLQLSDILNGRDWIEELLPIGVACGLVSKPNYSDKGYNFEHSISFSIVSATESYKQQLLRLQRNGFLAFAVMPDKSARALGDEFTQCRLNFTDDSGNAPADGAVKMKVEITALSKVMPYYIWNGIEN